jgi:tripartite-type tricarboxylate transporter receptor subunit TctC
MAGVQMTRIPYKGAAPAMTALITGGVQMVLSGIGTLLPQAKAGKVRALAVTGAKRSSVAPEIPTASEAGVPGNVATTWYMMLAPAGTPRPIIDRLNGDLRKLLADAEVRTQLQGQGIELTPSAPEECGEFLAEEVAKWEKVVRATGVKID